MTSQVIADGERSLARPGGARAGQCHPLAAGAEPVQIALQYRPSFTDTKATDPGIAVGGTCRIYSLPPGARTPISIT